MILARAKFPDMFLQLKVLLDIFKCDLSFFVGQALKFRNESLIFNFTPYHSSLPLNITLTAVKNLILAIMDYYHPNEVAAR